MHKIIVSYFLRLPFYERPEYNLGEPNDKSPGVYQTL